MLNRFDVGSRARDRASVTEMASQDHTRGGDEAAPTAGAAAVDTADSAAFAHNLSDRDFRRILIIKPSSLGDVVHALPVLHGLRQRYPAAHVAWLIAPPFDALIRDHPALDEVIPFDRRVYGRMLSSPAAVRRFIGFLAALRRGRFDLVIDLQGLFRSGFLARATAAPVRIGFAEAREFAHVFYTHRIPRRPADTHAVDRNYAVADLLGFASVPITFDLALTQSETTAAFRRLAECAPGDGPLIAILPGARWETKRWPADRFAETIRAIRERRLGRCLLLGSPDERDLCDRIAAASADDAEPVANLAGRTSLREMTAIIGLCNLVLCHDSAPLHIAVALRRPVVCITGPTNPSRTGPFRRPESVCRIELDCSPCYYRRLRQCPHAHRCMVDLSVDHVLERVRAVTGSLQTPVAGAPQP
ncbi:MAG: lipopolysaccharide heptosyltransferase II [Phycisphaerales bacterium]|nr:MAG: lipopolysaccharide heptosyltransferase II [Phycisphaerales bacterium]